MHELSLCQGLIGQLEALARHHTAKAITRVYLRIGPLSGIEISLLKQAFTLARVGTVANGAELQAEPLPIRIRCKTCAAEHEALPNRLLCEHCGDWHTELLSGDEMLLSSVELELEDHDV